MKVNVSLSPGSALATKIHTKTENQTQQGQAPRTE